MTDLENENLQAIMLMFKKYDLGTLSTFHPDEDSPAHISIAITSEQLLLLVQHIKESAVVELHEPAVPEEIESDV